MHATCTCMMQCLSETNKQTCTLTLAPSAHRLSVTKVGCGTTNSAQRNLNDAVATSFFKMSKWYAVNNINQGFAFGVDRQPWCVWLRRTVVWHKAVGVGADVCGQAVSEHLLQYYGQSDDGYTPLDPPLGTQ